MHGAGRVRLSLVGARHIGELSTVQDIEVVIRSVAARVTLCSDGGAEDNQVLGNTYACQPIHFTLKKGGWIHTSMDDVHSAHCTAGIVKHPLLLEIQMLSADFGLEL